MNVPSDEKITEFWQWFVKHELKLYNALYEFYQGTDDKDHQTPKQILNVFATRLKRVNPLLTYEFFLLKDDNHRFVCHISAGGKKVAFPVVLDTVKQAPVSSYFYFEAFKAAHKNPKELLHMSLGHGDSSLAIKDIFYQSSKVSDKVVSIDIYIKKYDGNYEENLQKIYFILDKVIGEYNAATYIGEIQLHKLTDKKGLHPLVELSGIMQSNTASQPIHV
ncbi:hypothetical protein CN918_31120 [Priestia megaterium]|nr:hypothetical protein CN918_31120 [Priestia megaterium]